MKPLVFILTTLIAGHAVGGTVSHGASCSGVYDFDALATNRVDAVSRSSTRCIYSAPAPIKKEVDQQRKRFETNVSSVEARPAISAAKPKTEQLAESKQSNKTAHVQELAKRLMSSVDITAERGKLNGNRNHEPNKKEPSGSAPTTSSLAKEPTWEIPAGEKLSTAIKRWGDKEGWKIIWKPNYDYVVKAPLQYQAQFLDAVKLLFTDYAHAKQPFYVDAYRSQKIIVITPGGAS